MISVANRNISRPYPVCLRQRSNEAISTDLSHIASCTLDHNKASEPAKVKIYTCRYSKKDYFRTPYINVGIQKRLLCTNDINVGIRKKTIFVGLHTTICLTNIGCSLLLQPTHICCVWSKLTRLC